MVKAVWMVQYNLAGLHRPYKLTCKSGGWWSSNGDFGESGKACPKNYERDNIVRRFFDTKEEADAFYKELDTYRNFIRNRM